MVNVVPLCVWFDCRLQIIWSILNFASSGFLMRSWDLTLGQVLFHELRMHLARGGGGGGVMSPIHLHCV